MPEKIYTLAELEAMDREETGFHPGALIETALHYCRAGLADQEYEQAQWAAQCDEVEVLRAALATARADTERQRAALAEAVVALESIAANASEATDRWGVTIGNQQRAAIAEMQRVIALVRAAIDKGMQCSGLVAPDQEKP